MQNSEETDENTLKFALNFKKHLRFDLGDIVYLRSDTTRKTAMVVSGFHLFDQDDDYTCTWINSDKELRSETFKDKILTNEPL